jgi:hypothetical protein
MIKEPVLFLGLEGEERLALYIIADAIYAARRGDGSIRGDLPNGKSRHREVKAMEKAWLEAPVREFPKRKSFQWWCELLNICPRRAQRLAIKEMNKPPTLEEHRGKALFIEKLMAGRTENHPALYLLHVNSGKTKRLPARPERRKESKKQSSSRRLLVKA